MSKIIERVCTHPEDRETILDPVGKVKSNLGLAGLWSDTSGVGQASYLPSATETPEEKGVVGGIFAPEKLLQVGEVCGASDERDTGLMGYDGR